MSGALNKAKGVKTNCIDEAKAIKQCCFDVGACKGGENGKALRVFAMSEEQDGCEEMRAAYWRCKRGRSAMQQNNSWWGRTQSTKPQ